MIALTRHMMINDDLGAFLQIPRAIGRMSALALEEVVFTLLLSNPNNFFSTDNKNYFEGAETALDIDSLLHSRSRHHAGSFSSRILIWSFSHGTICFCPRRGCD